MTAPAPIPLLDLAPTHAALRAEILEALARVVDGGQFILGPEVAAFEAEAAAFLGVQHAVGLNSGTDALTLGLLALGVQPGDEVITTPFTFVATAEAICHVGATPVYVDIDPRSLLMDIDAALAAVTARTRAIIPVHLFGALVDSAPLGAAKGVRVLEDAAQCFGARTSLGRRAGALGDAGAFSLFPSKNLGALGDGGLLVTDDEAVADAARALRAHGGKDKYRSERLGYNSRLDALQAAVLRVKLPHVDTWNDARRTAAQQYRAALADLDEVMLPPDDEASVYHQFTVRIGGGRRDGVQRALAAEGIASAVYYPVALHQLGHVRGRTAGTLVEAERACAEVLSLPMGPCLSEADVARVATLLRRAVTS